MYRIKDLLEDLEVFDKEAVIEIFNNEILIHNPTKVDGEYDWSVYPPINEDFEPYDIDCDEGYDPYEGCYTGDC